VARRAEAVADLAPAAPLAADALPAAVADAVERLTELVATVESDADERVQGLLVDLLRAVDIVHRAGLRRLDAVLREADLRERVLINPEVRLLFDLYDLGDDGDRLRAEAVLEAARPYIESHGGQLAVLDAVGGVVTVRLAGACAGCVGSTATLRHVIEQALRDGLPDFERMEVEIVPERPGHVHVRSPSAQPASPPGLIQIDNLRRPERPTLDWRSVMPVAEVLPGTVRGVAVEGLGVLVVGLDGEVYAYRDVCPGTPLPLASGARLEGATLVCPWHGCRFDIRGGRRLDAEGSGLGVMPIAVVGAEIRIGVLRGGRS